MTVHHGTHSIPAEPVAWPTPPTMQQPLVAHEVGGQQYVLVPVSALAPTMGASPQPSTVVNVQASPSVVHPAPIDHSQFARTAPPPPDQAPRGAEATGDPSDESRPASEPDAAVRVRILPIVGALIAAVGTFLPWISHNGFSIDSHDIAAVAAYGQIPTSPDPLRLGTVIVAVAAAGLILSLVQAAGPLYRLAGALTMAAAGGWAYHSHEALADRGAGDQFMSMLGAGVWTTLAGGAILAATR